MAEPEKSDNKPAESGGGDNIRTLGTFMAGVLVGAALVYFVPPASTEGGPGQMGGDPAAMGGTPLQPPPGSPGAPPDGATPGTPGAAPGTPGETPGTPPDGATPGTPGPLPDGSNPGTLGTPPNGATPGIPGTPPDGATPGTPGMPPAGGTPGTPGEKPVESVVNPADGGKGTPAGPPPGTETPSPTPANPPPSGGTRLEKHLRMAPTLWNSELAEAKASKDPAILSLVPDIKSHIATIPQVGEMLPPMPEVASYLADSRVLLDRMSAAGMDVAELSTQIASLLRPPKGTLPPPPN